MKKINVIQIALLLVMMFFVQDSHSVLYNVDFKSVYPGFPTYVGKGVLGDVADNTWNGLRNSTVAKSDVALVDARGAASSATFSCSGFGGEFGFTNPPVFAWGDFADFWYLDATHASATISFSNLPAGQFYDLILFSFAGGTDEIMQAAVNGGTQQATSGIQTGVIQWTENPDSKSNLLRFTGTVPENGIISIVLTRPNSSADISGMQLQVGSSSLPVQGTRTYKLIPDLAAGYNLKVMTIGTSLTDQPYGVSWPSQLYTALYPNYQGHITLSNRAISGSNSKSGVDNIESWLAADNPDVVFIEYAINDAVAADNITVTEMKSNLDFICAKIKANNPNADIILQTMNNPAGDAFTARPNLELYYQGFRDYAALHGYMLVDNYPLWKSLYNTNPTLWATYVPDNIHPNDAGRAAVMIDNLVATLETALTPDAAAPSVPTGLSSGTITPNSIVLNWTASTDNVGVTGYDVYQGGNLIGSTVSNTYTVNGLTASTLYNFQVRAKDLAANYSAKCTAVDITTASPDVVAPSAPANLTHGAVTSNSVVLNWTASFDALGVAGYDVYQGDDLIGTTASTTYTVSALSASTGYSFTVKAKDAANNISDASNSLKVTTDVYVVSSTYRYLKLTVNAHTSANFAPIFTELEWMVGATSYPTTKMAWSATNGTATVSASFASDAGSLWKAFDGGYDEGWSYNPVADGVFSAFPYSITLDLGAGNGIYPTELKLGMASWSGRGIQTYCLEGSNDNLNWTNLKTVTTTPTTVNANTISISAPVQTSLAPIHEHNVALYPNPVLDKLTLNFGMKLKNAEVTIFDIQGSVMLTKNVINSALQTMDVSSLNSGVYFVKVTSKGKIMNSRFLKK